MGDDEHMTSEDYIDDQRREVEICRELDAKYTSEYYAALDAFKLENPGTPSTQDNSFDDPGTQQAKLKILYSKHIHYLGERIRAENNLACMLPEIKNSRLNNADDSNDSVKYWRARAETAEAEAAEFKARADKALAVCNKAINEAWDVYNKARAEKN